MPREQHDIRVSSAILGADLTQAEKMVYIAIRSRQGRNPWCFASQQVIADDIGSAKAFVNRTIKKLSGEGWIEKEGRKLRCLPHPCGDSQSTNVDQESPPPKEASGDQESTDGDSQSTDGDQESPRTENQQLKLKHKGLTTLWSNFVRPPLPAPSFSDEDVRLLKMRVTGCDFAPDDWEWQFAEAALARMDTLGILSGVVQKQIRRDGRLEVLNSWAHTFRLLSEQDGWAQQQIKQAMGWVLQHGNRWVENRWLQSIPSLRKKISSGDKTKFEAILNQARTVKTNGHSSASESNYRSNLERILRAAARGAASA